MKEGGGSYDTAAMLCYENPAAPAADLRRPATAWSWLGRLGAGGTKGVLAKSRARAAVLEY